jgi:hypothetical protein
MLSLLVVMTEGMTVTVKTPMDCCLDTRYDAFQPGPLGIFTYVAPATAQGPLLNPYSGSALSLLAPWACFQVRGQNAACDTIGYA